MSAVGRATDAPPINALDFLRIDALLSVTYEGTADIHTLVLGQALTGLAAYR